MPWLDLDQPQPQFNPMGWLGGAQAAPEDPSVVLARRMRQQSPNVPAGRGGVGSDYAASGGAGPAPIAPESAPSQGGGGFAADFNKGMRRVLPPWWHPENVPQQSMGLPGRDFEMVPPWMKPQNAQDVEAGVPWNPEGAAAPATGARPSIPTSPGDMEEVFPPPSVTADGQPTPGGAPGAAGNVPMPRPNPFAAGAGAQLPPNATSAVGAPPEAQPQPKPQPSFLERIGTGINNNSDLLLALGAGFAGAPSFGTGMQRALTNAQPVAGRNQTVEALIKKGLSPEDARMAASNPDTLKHLLPQIFGAKQLQSIKLKGPMGEEIPLTYDQASGKYYDAGGKPYGQGNDAGGAGGIQLLAPGVKYNPEAIGEDYLNQFSPEVKAATKAYLNGDVMPSGNPRMQGIANYAKTVAQKYGADMGIPVSDSLYAQRRAYRTQLGGSSPSSVGGQSKAFNQGVHHMSELADQLVALDNKDPLGIPKLAEGVNWLRQASSSKQSAISDEASSIGQTLAGEVGKLFSGSAGGGVHERELTRSRFSTIKSNEQLAAALDATLKMMHGGLSALEGERDRQLGPNNDVKFVSKQSEENIAKIESVIARLRGQSPAPAAGARPAAAPVPGLPQGWGVQIIP